MSVAAKSPVTVKEYEHLFERYLEVCNQALERNKNRFPFKEIWSARWKTLGPNDVLQVAVYDDRPKIVFTLRLNEDMKIQIIEKTCVEPEDVWPLQYSYLKHVVENPEDYIEHPATLDWGYFLK